MIRLCDERYQKQKLLKTDKNNYRDIKLMFVDMHMQLYIVSQRNSKDFTLTYPTSTLHCYQIH